MWLWTEQDVANRRTVRIVLCIGQREALEECAGIEGEDIYLLAISWIYDDSG